VNFPLNWFDYTLGRLGEEEKHTILLTTAGPQI